MKKKVWLTCIAALAVYASLLAILLGAEGNVPAASIRSLGDAVWFSLVTLTTVGYGDLYPVSPLGKAIGLVFVLLSAGLLASVIGLTAGFLRDQIAETRQRMKLRRHSCWLFSEMNAPAIALAKSLRESGETALMVFCGMDRKEGSPIREMICVPWDVVWTSAECGEVRGVFLIGEDSMENAAAAIKLRDFSVFCRGEEIPGEPSVSFFDEMSCTARAYWQRFPLKEEEREIWIVGDGSLAQALLNQAILANCRVPFQKTVYHLFGSWQNYERLHPGLWQVFDRTEEGDQDTLLFYNEEWTVYSGQIGKAHRIIFCGDEMKKNAGQAALMKKYYGITSPLHIAGSAPISLGESFGSPEEIWTAETVLRASQDQLAREMHQRYSRGAANPVSWEKLPPFLKASNRAAADHAVTKMRILAPEAAEKGDEALCLAAEKKWHSLSDREPYRRNEHLRWMRFYALYNWRAGSERNEDRRIHPDLIPYDNLSETEREKDDLAWESLKKCIERTDNSM